MNSYLDEYEKLGDAELLQLACDRDSLTGEAQAALGLELSRRKLTAADQHKYQHDQKRRESLKSKRLARRALGTRRGREQWFNDLIRALVALFLVSLIEAGYRSGQHHLRPDWEEAAMSVLFASVFIAVFGHSWWRKAVFWFSLLISSGAHLALVHSWIMRDSSFHDNHKNGKMAVLLGIVLFLVIYGVASFLRQRFRDDELGG